MKEALILQAQYNKFANASMFETLKKVKDDSIYKDCGLYYDSIMKTAGHYIGGQIAIFICLFNSYADKKPSNLDEILESLKDIETIQEDVDSLAKLCQKADDAIIDIIQNTSDFNKIENLEFPGVTFTKPRAFLMLAILNHSTHHRGQIAGALDILKIENDFNGMLGM